MKDKKKNWKRIIRFIIALLLFVCMIIGVIFFVTNATDSGSGTYRETKVEYGDLVVGIRESGTVDIGTVSQNFELDMSSLTRVTTSNYNSSSSDSGGGQSGNSGFGGTKGGNSLGSTDNMFSQLFSMGSSNGSIGSSNKSDSDLVVESIPVTVGQEISAGDVIVVLKEDGVEKLKTELEENTQKAAADLEALIADQKLSMITAEYTLKTSLEYGDYASKEKKETIDALKADVESAENSLNSAKSILAAYKGQLSVLQTDYENAVSVLKDAEWCRDNTDKINNTFAYTQSYNEATTASNTVSNLERSISQLESKITAAESNVDRCETNLAKAKRNYASGVLSAEKTYELRLLAYETAQETYDITVSYLEDDLKAQQENYEETLNKWNEFTSYIEGVNILSDYSGVITDIELSEGDGVGTGSTLITLYNKDDVTITVTLSEDDMGDVVLGGDVNVKLTAYEDVFEGIVTDISDASTDSSGNTTRDVTITVKGDLSKLYQGMTAEVTIITKQVENVLYVQNRAIIRENGISYVKVLKEDGSLEKVKVITGFSDGTNVEILEGLSQGQTVIIEKGETK